jgi:hypothetical protein
VADAGLGTINAVRLSTGAANALESDLVVVLNRFDHRSELHQRNRDWLRTRDALSVVVLPGDEAALSELVVGR